MRKAAFTLLELMIAVIIVGILASLAIPMFQGAVIKAKCAEIFVIGNFYDREFESLLLEYGPDLDVIGEKLPGFKTTERFHIQVYRTPSDGRLLIRFNTVELGNQWLCSRNLYLDSKTWTIKDNHSWAKYLNIPGAEHE
jgi:prepilin-type N-terminal cleavage/methylation domain-containing protein